MFSVSVAATDVKMKLFSESAVTLTGDISQRFQQLLMALKEEILAVILAGLTRKSRI